MLLAILSLMSQVYSQDQVSGLTAQQQQILKLIQNTPDFKDLDPRAFAVDPSTELPSNLKTTFLDYIDKHPQRLLYQKLKLKLGDDWVFKAGQFGAKAKEMGPRAMNGALEQHRLFGADFFSKGAFQHLTPADYFSALRARSAKTILTIPDMAELSKLAGSTSTDPISKRRVKDWLRALASLEISDLMIELFEAVRLEEALVQYAKLQRFNSNLPRLDPWIASVQPVELSDVFGRVEALLKWIESFQQWYLGDAQRDSSMLAVYEHLSAFSVALQNVSARFSEKRVRDLNSKNTLWKNLGQKLDQNENWLDAFSALAASDFAHWILLANSFAAVKESELNKVSEGEMDAISSAIAQGLWDIEAGHLVWDMPENANWPIDWIDLVTALGQADLDALRSQPGLASELNSVLSFLEQNQSGRFFNSPGSFLSSHSPWANLSAIGIGDGLDHAAHANTEELVDLHAWLNPYQQAVEKAVAAYGQTAELHFVTTFQKRNETEEQIETLLEPFGGDLEKAKLNSSTWSEYQRLKAEFEQLERDSVAANVAYEKASSILKTAEALDLYKAIRGETARRSDRAQVLVDLVANKFQNESNFGYFLHTFRSKDFLARVNLINDGVIGKQDKTAFFSLSALLRRISPTTQGSSR